MLKTVRLVVVTVAALAAALSADATADRQAQGHWAFAPPKMPAVPQVKRADWPRTDIDRFILAELEEKGLEPAGPDRKSVV